MQWPEAGLEEDFLGRQIPQYTIMLEEEGENKLRGVLCSAFLV
jgi:hypothetical protein